MPIESVVRPFQINDPRPPERAPEAQVVPIKNTVINPGAQGSVKTMSGHYDITITYYMINQPKELTQDQANQLK